MNYWANSNFSPHNDSSFPVTWQLTPQVISASSSVHEFPPWSIPVSDQAEDKATAVSKSHSQAEKRRRDRINAQLATLRKLIPKSEKVIFLSGLVDSTSHLNLRLLALFG